MNLQFRLFIFLLVCTSISWSQKIDNLKTNEADISIQPILHGSLVLTFQNKTIYVDPYGGAHLYANIKSPDFILITDIHGDHLQPQTLDSLDTSKTIFIVPQAVADKLPEKYKSKIIVLNNGQGVHRSEIFFKAMAMYNLPETEGSKHPKGRGNGYVLTIGDKQIYISGDTEDIEEMRMLQNIDVAFVCMNLPYTMDVHQAASAVLDFEPKVVYPYHFRGKDGFSDVTKFKKLVSENPNIEVRLAKWYPES